MKAFNPDLQYTILSCDENESIAGQKFGIFNL